MPDTTDKTCTRDLAASLAIRSGVPAGVTWGSFQAAMRILGVRDEDRLDSIEYGVAQGGTNCLIREDGPAGIEIRERWIRPRAVGER